jgi:hypothetical protein
MPPILECDRAVKEIAEIFIKGDKELSLPKHATPTLGSRAKYSQESKVLKRLRTEEPRLPFLL